MTVVKFTNVAEFVAELRADAGLIDRGILRATHSWRSSPPLTVLSVLATAVVAGRLVVLECRCGAYMFADTDGADAAGRAVATMTALRALAAELKLELRPGVFEAA
jgi:hypothetical protein